MPSQTQIRQKITETIIETLRNGDLPPWRRPWSNDPNSPGLHTSLSTGNPYRGINQLLLQVAGMRNGFRSKWWGTYRQVQQCGANVRKGQKGTHIVLYKPIRRTRIDEDGEEVDDTFCVMRTFTVFNSEQTNGLKQFRVGFTKPEQSDQKRHEHADRVLENTAADIRYGGNQAFYRPEDDFIQLPYPYQFEAPEAFYETAFHELIHWSEHPIRLNWDRASEGYAMGELIAEIGACFLMGELNLPTTERLDNHAAYLSNWLTGMNEDPKFIFRASAQANKAVDYILSFSRQSETASQPQSEPVFA